LVILKINFFLFVYQIFRIFSFGQLTLFFFLKKEKGNGGQMTKKENMAELSEKMMADRKHIRNIGTVAHIDHGKCIAPKTRIQLADGRIVSAEQLYNESVLAGEKAIEDNEKSVFALKKEVPVFSVNKKTGKIEKKNISHAWKLKGGEMLKIKLRNGNEISTTPEHKYLSFDGAEFNFKEAKELKIKDKIVVPRKLECENSENIDANALKLLAKKPFYVLLKKSSSEALKEKISEKGFNYFCETTKKKIAKRTYYETLHKGRYLLSDLVILCNDLGFKLEAASDWIEKIGLKDSVKIDWAKNWHEIFYLAGLMIGDGSYNRFVVGKKELGKKFEEICRKLGFTPIERNFAGKTFEYQTNTTLLHVLNALFDYPLKKKSHNVKISCFAKQAPNYLLAELLKAYFDCDGTVEKSRSAVSISTASKQMIQDLQLVLTRFGCVPIIGKENTVYITGNSVKNFNEQIGFFLKEKRFKAEMLGQKSVGSIVCDTVPCEGLKKLREQKQSKASISHHYYKYENLSYAPLRETYKQITATLLKEKEIQIPSIDDLAFIEIKEIEKSFEETVYDFSVPENQNFVAEGIVVHNTTLSDALIAAAGLISQEVAGTAQIMDYEDQEQQRGITINAANISLVFDYENEKTLINLIDTPGHVDFTGEVIRAMRAVDGVIVVVDAVEGIMPQTETVIRQALKEYVKPVLFINKVDRLINELKVSEEEMQKRFVKVITAINSLISKNAADEFKEKWLVNPANGSVAFGSAKRKWAVSVPYMQKSKINFKQIYAHLKNDDQKKLAEISPVYEVVLKMVRDHLPNPLEAQKYRIKNIWAGDLESEIGKAMQACSETGEVAMMITDVSVNPHVGDIATGRIYAGTLKNGVIVKLLGMQKEIRIQKVGVFMGPEFIDVDKAEAGNVAAIVGLKEVFAGETISTIEMKEFESFKSSVEPVMTVSVEAKQTKDLPKLIQVLKQLSKEDPNLRASINQETGEHLLSGMGELHLDVNRYRIEETHKIPITMGTPIVVYKETITKPSQTLEGISPNRHNKFKIKVEPIPDEILQKLVEAKIEAKIRLKDKEIMSKLEECGFEKEMSKKTWCVHNNNVLVDSTRGIVALHEIKELVIQGFEDAMNEGPIAKEKCFGVMVILDDATLHEDSIHRGPAQVLPAITRTIFAGMLSTDHILLEPKQLLSITVPRDYMGAVTKELGSKRTQISEIRTEGDTTVIVAKAPVKELIGFSADMRGATQGRAVWTAEYAGYEILPKELQKSIITEVRKRKGLEPEPKQWQFFLE
jgi:elongation factor 2